MRQYHVIWSLLLTFCVAPGVQVGYADDFRAPLGSPEAWNEMGIAPEGRIEWDEGHKGQAPRFTGGAHLKIPTPPAFDPKRGAIRFWVKPEWSGESKERHALLNMQHNRTHLTLFKTEGSSLRFAYRGKDKAWFGLDATISHWRPGEWHQVTADWRETSDGRLLLILDLDGNIRSKTGASPFETVPTHILVGARGPNLEPADAVIDELCITDTNLAQSPFPIGPKATVQAVIDATVPGTPRHAVHDMITPWNSKACPLPFTQDSAYHKRLAEGGFSLARLVAFSDTWLWGTRVEKSDDGKLLLDFTDFDAMMDLTATAGAEPYIRLAYNIPAALRPKPATGTNRNAYAVPDDLSEWDELMERIVTHCVSRGDRKPRYYVTSLNEADMSVVKKHCTWEQVCDLYARTTRIVRRIDPQAKVGGPAIAYDPRDKGAPYMRNFLAFCAKESLPLDFICYHGYRKGQPKEYEEMLQTVRKMVRDEYPALHPEPEYFLDEFNLWEKGAAQDNEYGASYITAAQHFMKRGGITKVGYVSFNHFIPDSNPETLVVEHQGPFNKTANQTGRFLAMELTANGVTKRGILAHAPSGGGHRRYTFGEYAVSVPKTGRPRLEFSTGLAIARHPRMDGVTFEVVAKTADSEDVLLTVHQSTLDWVSRSISLEAYAGKKVLLQWRTRSGPERSTAAADWGAWGEPQLVTDMEGKATPIYDFTEMIADARTGIYDPGRTFVYGDEAIWRYGGLPLLKGPVVTTPYFALKMQSMLTGPEIPVQMAGEGGITSDGAAGIIATKYRKGARLLLWTFDLGYTGDRQFSISLKGLEANGTYCIKQFLIDKTHSNPYYRYVVAGEDTNSGKYNLETGAMDVIRADSATCTPDGTLKVETRLGPMAVSLIEISPQ